MVFLVRLNFFGSVNAVAWSGSRSYQATSSGGTRLASTQLFKYLPHCASLHFLLHSGAWIFQGVSIQLALRTEGVGSREEGRVKSMIPRKGTQ